MVIPSHLPLGVVVLLQLALMGAGHDEEAAVVGVDLLHGGPRAYDAVGGPGEARENIETFIMFQYVTCFDKIK